MHNSTRGSAIKTPEEVTSEFCLEDKLVLWTDSSNTDVQNELNKRGPDTG